MADFIYSDDPLLDAVNTVISSVGSPPINSLNSITNVDAIDALRMLLKTSREVQSKGWAWNSQYGTTLTPDSVNGKVSYTRDIIKAISGSRLVNKGGFFFDLDANTDIFTTDLSFTELVREFNFEDLPEAAREYITAKTSRDFQRIKVGSPESDQPLAIREMEALAALNALEIEMGNYNLYDNNETVSSNQAR